MGSASSQVVSRFELTGQNIVDEFRNNVELTSLYVLVTGATSGIGLETARVLACNGATVYVMGRQQIKVQETVDQINRQIQEKSSSGSAEGVLCDLNSLDSVKQFADEFIKDNRKLNILILNAGIFNIYFSQTQDGIEQVIGVNHISQAYLTNLLIPLLIKNAPARIVVVSAKLHEGPPINYENLEKQSSQDGDAKKSWNPLRSYQQSKLANLLYARALAVRYRDKCISAYSLHPGVITTNLGGSKFLIGLVTMFFKKKTVEQGAATTVFCSLKPGLEVDSGRYFDDSTVTELAEKWTDADVNQFYEWTENIIQKYLKQH